MQALHWQTFLLIKHLFSCKVFGVPLVGGLTVILLSVSYLMTDLGRFNSH